MGKMFPLWLWVSAALFQTVLRNKPSVGRGKVADQPTDGPTLLSWEPKNIFVYRKILNSEQRLSTTAKTSNETTEYGY